MVADDRVNLFLWENRLSLESRTSGDISLGAWRELFNMNIAHTHILIRVTAAIIEDSVA